MLSPSEKRSFLQKHLLDKPSSAKAGAARAAFLFSAVAALLIYSGLRDDVQIQKGTVFDCAGVVDRTPERVSGTQGLLLSVLFRISDDTLRCKEASGSGRRKGIYMPSRFHDEATLGKGRPVRVYFGQDVNDEQHVVGVISDQGKVVVNRKVINEGLALLNDKDRGYIITYSVAAGVAGVAWLHYRRRARQEKEEART